MPSRKKKAAQPKKSKTEVSPADIVAALRQKFGSESAMLVGQDSEVGLQAVCPTGLTVLDRYVLGVGGIPWGRVGEVFGPESSGKTTLANMVLAGAQRDGAIANLIEVEHTWEPAWAQSLGVNLDELVLEQPSYLDGADGVLAIIGESLAKANKRRRLMFVIDSVASLCTKAEFEEGLQGEAAMAEQARIWSNALRKLVALLSEAQSTVLFVNQVRAKPGVMFGPTETTPGGNAIKFYSSFRLRPFHGKKLDKGAARIMGVTAVKNKVAPPHRSAEFKLNFDGSFDDWWSILNHAKDVGCIGESAKRSKDTLTEALNNLGWGNLIQKLTETPDGDEADETRPAEGAV